MYKNSVKRMIDVVLATTGVVLLSPVMLIIVVMIKIDDSHLQTEESWYS